MGSCARQGKIVGQRLQYKWSHWEAKGKLRYPMALTQKQQSAARISVYATAGRAKATLTTGRRARGEKDVFLRRYRCSGGGFWQGDTTKPPLLGFALVSDCFTGCATL